MLKTKERIQDENIRYLKNVILNFDKFEILKKYVYKYNSHIRDYEYKLHKLNQNTIYMYIYNNKIEINKISDDKFEVIIDLDDYLTIATMRRIKSFTRAEDKHILWYYHGTWHFVLDNLIIPIRYNKRLIKMIFIKKHKEYYLTLPELEKREFSDEKYGFPIIKGSIYLYQINNKKVEKIIDYYKKKYKGMPYMLRVKMKNRKAEYMIFKMMLNKNIVELRDKQINVKSLYPIRRIRSSEIEDYMWCFTNIVSLNIPRIRGVQFPDFVYATLQDYSYDSTNQILLKFIDEYNHTFLCGVDYGNRLWCQRLQGFMFKYSIRSVYKALYNLEPETKVFEF